MKSVLLLLLALSTAGAARAGDTLDALGLTKQQQQQVSAIRGEHRAEIASLTRRLGDLKAELLTVIQAPTKSAEHDQDLSTRFERVLEAKRELSRARFKVALAVRGILNPEQLAKFKGMRGKLGKSPNESND